ncbi:MAG: DJ-1 family glyoxalase III [Planctomycetota bacterium]|nr:DJ-1 family glyoxalase III [Planctomycetota bacterium]
MPGICVLLATGFEEIEAITVIDVLRRAELEVTILGVDGETISGSHGLQVATDQSLEDGLSLQWDAVVLPGGLPGATNLRDHPQVIELVRSTHSAGGKLAAICAAPIVLGSAGVLQGRRATCYPGFEDGLEGAECSEERVVVDGNLTTSRGPGTSLDFALSLVAQLKDQESADTLRKGMLVSS